jgi:hypothetical protein
VISLRAPIDERAQALSPVISRAHKEERAQALNPPIKPSGNGSRLALPEIMSLRDKDKRPRVKTSRALEVSAQAHGTPTTTLEISPYVQANKDAQALLLKFPATGIEPVANRCLLQGKHLLQSVALPSELYGSFNPSCIRGVYSSIAEFSYKQAR